MDLNLIIKILLLIVVIGVSFKIIKYISGFIFKLALIGLILLFVYNMFLA